MITTEITELREGLSERKKVGRVRDERKEKEKERMEERSLRESYAWQLKANPIAQS